VITTSDEAWATNTLRDAQDPGAGKQSWAPLTRITIEKFNLVFAQQHSRGYGSTGQPQHDAGTALENGFATLLKVAACTASDDLVFTKWSVSSGLEYDDVSIVPGASLSNTARPSMEITAGVNLTIRVFYVDEDDDYIHHKESSDGGATFGAEVNVGAQTNLKAIASVSPTKVHCVSYASGSSRFHYFEYDGSWSETNSLIYWPHMIEHIDAITIGDRDLIVFYSEGPMYGQYREAGIYGIWVEHGRWSDIFKIDVLDEADAYAYRKHPMISTANGLYFLTGYLSEGDEDYSHTTRFLKISGDGQNWSQYMPLVACPEAGPAKLLVVNAASGQSWPWDTGQQVYLVGYDKVYESDATRLVGEINAALQVDVKSRTRGWQLQRGVISQGNTILSNHDGALDAHAIINANNTLLLKREAGYRTGLGDEYAQVTLETVDFIKETDELPQRHKQVVSRDFMAWVRDREADHFEYWESQLVGYDNYTDDTETGYGGLGHTATQKGWWETKNNVLWLRSNNEIGLAFATWDSKIMNGQVKAMIRVETSGNGEYAGVVFRAKDEGNLWAAYYNQGTDKIVLRQRAGDAWMGIVAQSSGALGWSIDTYYGIMVDFRYNYIRVFRSTDGNTWTLDFTHIITPNALNPAPEYGYTGLLGYGYSSEDEEKPPGYEPPLPPVSPPATGSGQVLYMVCSVTGRVFRTRNARDTVAANVLYEDLGVVNAGGLTYIALDSWDPKNRAMVIGPNGVWRTTNLNDTTPTWTQVLDLNAAGYLGKMIVSSICQQGLWMLTCQTTGETIRIYWTVNDGDSWSFTGWSGVGANNDFPKIECSSHNAQIAWVTWVTGAGTPRVTKTTDLWSSSNAYTLGTDTYNWPANPHHRYLNNADDNLGFYAGGNTTQWCTADYGTCSGGTLDGGGKYQDRVVHWIGSYTWGTQKFWALTIGVDGTTKCRFHVSDDCVNWTRQYDFTGMTRFISGFPYQVYWFYAAQDGTTAPLLISDDRGESWQAQTGNWNTLCTTGGYDPDIYCIVPVWVE
jgi:hypothetical protein